ncbi:MAG: S-methyl-5-thioribose-1-phosphate isomerase [archaeon]
MNKKLEQAAKDIREMKIQGAISIALTAANAMESVITDSKAKSRAEFMKEVEDAGEILISTRPTAVALPNAVKEFVREVKESKAEFPKLKKDAIKIAHRYIEHIKTELQDIGKIGATLIDDGDIVLIHCHSGTVMEVLKAAWNAGKRFEVFSMEARPWGQGYLSTKELSDFGIPTTLIIDNAAWTFMEQSSKVLVGADTITRDGAVINKVGTAGLALIAKHFNKPFYVATEMLKLDRNRGANQIVIEERPADEIIDPKKLPNAKIRNPIFDVTEPEFITKIITEEGVFEPADLVK